MQHWKLSALAAATLALTSITASNAWALALGRLTVRSALGEPLRAEVEIPQLSAAEADSLKAAIASPEVFRAQGVEYADAVHSVRVKVIKHANGSAVLQLSSFQPVNDPFLYLVIDANWTSSRLLRSYTLLLDPPPSLRTAPGKVNSAPVKTRSGSLSTIVVPTADEGRQPIPSNSAKAAVPTAPGSVRVKKGDTAGRIASTYRPAGVSQNQMLAAMLRANPQAFIDGNINRLRSGIIIQMPDEATAKATPPNEARRTIAVQSGDPHPPARNRLTLSMDDLDADEKPAAPAATDAVSAPAAAAPRAEPADKSVDEAKFTEPAAPPALSPAPTPLHKPVPAPTPAPPEPSFVGGLMEAPGIPLAGTAILALLLGYGGYRVVQRRKAAAMQDDAAYVNQFSSDSVFSTHSNQPLSTLSLMPDHPVQYSTSQLDARDADPLAEADVYLAYGRALQAEEILKEALRTAPSRLALHQKLAEIYAKHHDRRAFEATAQTLHALTQGQGTEWQRLAEQGRTLDPENALYQQGSGSTLAHSSQSSKAPVAESAAILPNAVAAATSASNTTNFETTLTQPRQEMDPSAPSTRPLNLDLSMDLPGGLADAEPVRKIEAAPAMPVPSDQDFAALGNWGTLPAAQASLNNANAAEAESAAPGALQSLEFDLGNFTLPSADASATNNASIHSNAMEFDLKKK